MRGLTLPFTQTIIYGPIVVDLRENLELLSLEFFFFSRAPLCLFLLTFLFFLFILFLKKFWIHGSHCAMCPSLILVHFCPETIYFFSVQFSLNELSSIHFLTSDIFVKISSLKSLVTYHPKNRKNIYIVSEFDKTFIGH